MDNVIEFSPVQLKAPFILRCAALFIDYILFVILPVGWLISSKVFSESGAKGGGIGGMVWFLGALLFVVNFIALPLFRGQTIGKMFVGLTIVRSNGTPVGLVNIILRDIVGYILTALTLGLGFLLAAVTPSGRALHDLVGGTIVVRGRKVRL